MRSALIDLERRGWDALTDGGAAAVTFYDMVLATEPTMLLPGGLRLTDRASTLEAMSGTPWDSYRMDDVAVARVTDDVGLVSYAVEARRGEQVYSALVSSLYARRDGAWRLVAHQQTPR